MFGLEELLIHRAIHCLRYHGIVRRQKSVNGLKALLPPVVQVHPLQIDGLGGLQTLSTAIDLHGHRLTRQQSVGQRTWRKVAFLLGLRGYANGMSKGDSPE